MPDDVIRAGLVSVLLFPDKDYKMLFVLGGGLFMILIVMDYWSRY